MTNADEQAGCQVESPSPPNVGEEREYLWRQYNLWIDLYKFHIELVLKAIAFYFLLTGGMLSFAYPQHGQPLVRVALVLPVLLGAGIAVIFFYGAALTAIHRRAVLTLAQDLGFAVVPDANFLRLVLWLSAIIFTFTSVALAIFVIGWPTS